MKKDISQTHRDKISAKQKDSWSDPTKRVEQKKRIAAKKLLKTTATDIIESPNPLNIEKARQSLIELVQRRDKLSSILVELNNLREGQSL